MIGKPPLEKDLKNTIMKRGWDTIDGKEYKNQVEALEESDIQVIELIAKLVKRRGNMWQTQRELADKTGIKQSAIAHLETEEVNPQMDTVFRIAKELGLRIELVEEETTASK